MAGDELQVGDLFTSAAASVSGSALGAVAQKPELGSPHEPRVENHIDGNRRATVYLGESFGGYYEKSKRRSAS
jgi:hypothetical protein